MPLTDTQRIGYARQLKANPLWEEVTSGMTDACVAKWRGTAQGDAEKRTEAWYEDRALRTIIRRVDDLAMTELKEDAKT